MSPIRRADRRRPSGRPRRPARDARRRPGSRGRRRGGGRRRGARPRRLAAAGRHPDGPADAGHGRRGGDPALAEQGADARVLVLTTYDTDSDVVPALEAGATGYLLKDAPREQLVRAIQRRGPRRGGPRAIGRHPARQPAARARARGPQRPRARGPDADRPGRDESRRGGAPVHLRGDGQDAPAAHLRQARRQRPRCGGRGRLRARAARPAPDLSRPSRGRLGTRLAVHRSKTNQHNSLRSR